ncbi:unnamed protein product, partial [marine sediment metagenome]
LLLINIDYMDNEEYGEAVIYIYNCLPANRKFEFLRELGLLHYFYQKSGNERLLGVDNEAQLPLALKKLIDYLIPKDKSGKLRKKITKTVNQYSKKEHAKKVYGKWQKHIKGGVEIKLV